MNEIDRVASAVSEKRLWALVMRMAEFGGTAKGGVNRQAATAEDAAAQGEFMRMAAERGFHSYRDEIGNLFVRRGGTEAGAAPVLIGSHLDSQPTGGKFDGAYGVLAAFEVLEAISDAQLTHRRPIEVVAWMNEEGCRYRPGAMGSGVFAGSYDLKTMLDCKDEGGKVLGDELARVAELAPAPLRSMAGLRPAGYLEVHIEQGPLLEVAGVPIGIVSGIQGIRRFNIEMVGEEAHAGTTPYPLRKDAMVAGVSAISTLNARARAIGESLRFTVGSMSVSPNSPNTVPGAVRFTVDLRHPDDEMLTLFEATIAECVETAAHGEGCIGRVRRVSRVLPVGFDPRVISLLRDSATRMKFEYRDLMSGAGHDAMHIAKMCPTGMVFVPCHKGISHNEAESATASDLAAGARVLAAATMQMASED